MDPLTLAIGMPGVPELIIILIVALLIFGRRLPEVMRGLGKSVTEFKRGMNEITTMPVDDPIPPDDDPDDHADGKKADGKKADDKTAEKNIG